MLLQSPLLPSLDRFQRVVIATMLLLFGLALYGCRGGSALDASGSGPVPGFSLATPAQMLAQLKARGISATGQTKPGALYESTLPNNKIAINGTGLDFTPAWDTAGSPILSDLSYAIYLFDGTGLSGPSAVTSVWTAVPAAADLWLGLADFSKNRWDWFQPGVTSPLAITDIASYIDPGGSRILVAYALTGTAVSSLSSVTLGDYVPEIPLPVVPLTPVPMGGEGLAGPVLADGNPALAYVEDQGGPTRLIYMRALDADGTTWGTPVEIATGVTGTPGLQIIGGNPAVAFQTGDNGPLVYCRATDAQGAVWGATVEVDAATPGAGTFSQILEIAGRPAIAYLASGMDNNSQPVVYIRADDATGGSWAATPIKLNPEYTMGEQARYMSFAVIGGNPAVAYNWVSALADGLRYVRANDPAGDAWGEPQSIPGTGYDSINMLRNVDLVDLGGLPGIAYFIEDFGVAANSAVSFVDAQNVGGTSWDAPQVVAVAQPGEDPVNFGNLLVMNKLDGTQRAIVVANRGGDGFSNDHADLFDVTVPPGGGADFSTGVKHMVARFQSAKGPSLFRHTSCYGSVDTLHAMLVLMLLGGEEYVKIAAGMMGYDLVANIMGVSTTTATLPAKDF